MKPAFLIIDMQKEYYSESVKESMDSACEYINEVLGYYRNKKLPVIWVQDIDRESGVVPGAEGFELIDLLEKREGETVIFKEYGNSFNKTDLGKILTNENVDVIVMAGYCAEYCVLSTYRGAEDADFIPVLLKNGVAGGDKENLGFVEKICDTVPYKILAKIMENLE